MPTMPDVVKPEIKCFFDWFNYAQTLPKWNVLDLEIQDLYGERQAAWTTEMKLPPWNWTQSNIRDWAQLSPKLQMLRCRLQEDLTQSNDLFSQFDAYFCAFSIATIIQDHLESQERTSEQLGKDMAKRFFGRTDAAMANLAQEDAATRVLLANDLYRESTGDPDASIVMTIMRRSGAKKPPIAYLDETGRVSQFRLVRTITEYDEANDTTATTFVVREQHQGLMEVKRPQLNRMYANRLRH
ncbi:hypothetical protein CALVIDRAFT_536946 [Calocera viscosa TUFC12733]|uniref:Uncharacterized protein n=1 Tax=Calocera viscosa (strain TUFC12733) TaxID=1330018 RepID=A0A167MCS3_CALVF|nr:hypothetical protein CALVIDRAFT_536946 [Calocera viscosa TUFC12733]